MPTYVYRCNDCDYTFEAQQSFADKPLTDCPECAEAALRRVINSVGIVFKGSGFYITDNRNGKGSNGTALSSAASDSESKPAAESKSEKSDKGDKESPAKEKKEKKTEKSSEKAG